MTHDRRCKSCDRLIPKKRAATYPQAILCGADACTVLQHKRQNQRKQARWREKRIARDPGLMFEQKALAGCRPITVYRPKTGSRKNSGATCALGVAELRTNAGQSIPS